jgi:hypothetical protein
MYSRITCELTVVFGRFLRFPSFVIKTGFREFGHRFPNFLVSWFLWVSAGFCGFLRWRNPWKLKCLNTDVPLCRKFLFRSIRIAPRSYPQRSRPRLITLFGILFNSNPGISELVRNLVFHICSVDVYDDDVPLVLRRLQHLQSFKLGIGERMKAGWNEFHQPFREALLRLIQLPSVSRLEISRILTSQSIRKNPKCKFLLISSSKHR